MVSAYTVALTPHKIIVPPGVDRVLLNVYRPVWLRKNGGNAAYLPTRCDKTAGMYQFYVSRGDVLTLEGAGGTARTEYAFLETQWPDK